MTTLTAIKTAASKFFAAEPAAVEVEYTFLLPSGAGSIQVWVGRDLEIFDHPRFAN